MKKYLITLVAIFIFGWSYAYQCKKYVFDFPWNTAPGKLRISWSINKAVNGCGLEKEEILKHRFIVTIETLFEEVLIRDTISQSFYVLNTSSTDNSPVVVVVQELDGDADKIDFLVNPQMNQIPRLYSKLDSLNFYLMNGYFVNALPLLTTFSNADLITDLYTEYDILFPIHYPREQTYFNSYMDSSSMKLIKMPFVAGLSEFIGALNKMTAKEPKRSDGFKVFAQVRRDGKLGAYQVIPDSDTQKFEKFAHLLTFSNHPGELNPVVIIIGRTGNKAGFRIVNERALMDQNSKHFKRNFYRVGAVSR